MSSSNGHESRPLPDLVDHCDCRRGPAAGGHAVEVRVSVGVPSAPAVPAATTAAAAVSGRAADAPALPPATEITGRIGLVRAENSTGCVVAIDGHWFDVVHILAEPDVGLVQLHGVSSTGAQDWHHLDAGAVLQQCLDFPCIAYVRR